MTDPAVLELITALVDPAEMASPWIRMVRNGLSPEADAVLCAVYSGDPPPYWREGDELPDPHCAVCDEKAVTTDVVYWCREHAGPVALDVGMIRTVPPRS